uniref:Uncharacterized protein n=1 Tax=Cacopsylla melanoneura TaxID=428564 RepID=A0A8D8W3K5_9HEMI
MLPYVLKKYFEVTGMEIRASSIKNREHVPFLILIKIEKEKFDAIVTIDGGFFTGTCFGIQYRYPSFLLDIIERHPHNPEQEITQMITIENKGNCKPGLL